MRAFISATVTGCFLLCLTAAAAAQTATRELLISPIGTEPSVTATEAGGFVVAWQELHSGSGNDVLAQRFNGKGRPAGPVLAMADSLGEQLLPRVAADARGNFVVVWQGGGSSILPNAAGGDGQGAGIRMQLFDRLGRERGPQRIVNRTLPGVQKNPAVAMSADGAFTIAWDDCPPGTLGLCGVRAQTFSPAGRSRGTELEMEIEFADGFSKSPLVAAEPEGFAVGWTESEHCVSESSNFFKGVPVISRLSAAGRQIEPAFRLNDGLCAGPGWHLQGLSAGDEGAVALLGGARNSVQLFASSGEPAGSRRTVGQRARCVSGTCETVVTVAMNDSGRFAVLWQFWLPPTAEEFPPRYGLLAQFFDAQGQPLGDRFQVSPGLSRFDLGSAAAALADDGSLLIVWDRTGATQAGTGLFLRRFTLD